MRDARRLVVTVWTLAVALVVVTGAAGQQPPKWRSSSAPRPLPAREVKFPPYEVKALPNGLQAVVVVHNEQPAVSLRMIVRAGGAMDPEGKPGVAALVASLLDQGTITRSAQQIADTIDSAGGQLDTGVGRDLSFAHVVVMKDALALGMALLADVVRHPAFTEEELRRQRQQTLSALQVSYRDPEYVADVVFDRLVYGFNPYGSPGSGTAASVQAITRDDLVAFHRAHFVPNNCLLAVVGDVTFNEAMDAVAGAFGDWERREPRVLNRIPLPDPVRRLVVLDKPDAVQTEIRVGHLGIPRKNPDYMAVDLAIKILGGDGANRLHRVLRTERALTYGASADTETLERAGEFVAKTNTRSEATGEALRLIVDEYSRLRRERVSDEELSDAKAYLTGHFPLTIETPDDIATQVLNAVFYGLPLEELQTYRQRVNAVSVDDVARAAWKYVKPDRLSVVLVGNASAFLDQLRGVGFGKYEVVRLSDLDVTAADFKKKDLAAPPTERGKGGGPWPAGLPVPVIGSLGRSAAARHQELGTWNTAPAAAQGPTQSAVAPRRPDSAQTLLERAIKAKGGLEKLKSIKTVRAMATTTVMLPQGPVRTETTTYIEYPSHFRVEAHLRTGVAIQVYAGPNDVWVQDPVKGVIDVPPQARRDFKASVDRDLIPLLLRAAAGEVTMRLLDVEGGSGQAQDVRAIEVTGPDFDPVTLYIDSAGLVVRESFKLPAGVGTADELYTDYRNVDGLMVAFKASVRRNNLPVLERALSDFKVNPVLQPGLFEKPKAPGPAGRTSGPPSAAGATPAGPGPR